jgi:soluble lytic murein transglycosylase-like protein
LPESAGGDAAALRERAVRLEHGEGMARDLPQALTLYCRAARMGDAAAQYGMGWMLANGRGAARDDGAAAQLFALAAAQGHPQARAMLPYLQAAPQTPLPPCMLPGLALPAPEPRSYYLQGPGKDVAVLVDHLAPEYDIDPRLAMAFIQIESSFNPQAVSPRQAQGLMQLIPATAARFRVRDSFNPEQNIRGGLAYLRWLLTYFEGDVQLVAAAYNAGEKAVERYRGVPPYAETRDYVAKIMALYRRDRHSYNARSQQRELSKNLTPHLPNDPRLPTSP